ncbi:SRPBCC domain-containing protein [Chitinophaga sp. YIM B06452]|uniref:SRPBCC domain-containing protein n=1 Tax=Chitinophaga sp. YIM B06452 TaxID=3082158 RepID=UPI0031FED541
MEKKFITARISIHAPMEKVWRLWTEPQHILRWNQPSADWHTTHVENNAVTGGQFLYAMRAKDGSAGFDFKGVYDEVIRFEKISYTLTDGRETRPYSLPLETASL